MLSVMTVDTFIKRFGRTNVAAAAREAWILLDVNGKRKGNKKR